MNRSSLNWKAASFWWTKFVSLLFLTLFTLSALAGAQSLGTVTGTVTDQSGAVLGAAQITLHNESTGEDRATHSNDAGYFSFASVTPGAYTVKVTVANFKAWEHKGLPIRPGDVRSVEAVLQIGAATETVEVVTTADEVAPVDSGERSSVITAKQIKTSRYRAVTQRNWYALCLVSLFSTAAQSRTELEITASFLRPVGRLDKIM